MVQIPDEPLEIAFARNVRWLLKFGPRLPRHLVHIGFLVERHPLKLVMAEAERWLEAGDLLEDKCGDYRLTEAGMAKIDDLLDVDRSAA
jgi:hypothetical protein